MTVSNRFWTGAWATTPDVRPLHALGTTTHAIRRCQFTEVRTRGLQSLWAIYEAIILLYFHSQASLRAKAVLCISNRPLRAFAGWGTRSDSSVGSKTSRVSGNKVVDIAAKQAATATSAR
jgi:hypothetical protein